MKKIALIIALMTMSPVTVYAAQENTAVAMSAEKMTDNVVHVGINGMVCDFCAQSLKKVFLKEEAVSTVDISLEDKMITLGVKKGQTIDDATIKKLVLHAGYDVSTIHHMNETQTKK